MIARITLALMLFAQGIVAWSACNWLATSPDRAVVAAAGVAPCHDSGFGASCLTHCLSDRHAVQKAGMDVPAMPAAPVLTLAFAFGPVLRANFVPTPQSEIGPGPPRRILLQSFQV